MMMTMQDMASDIRCLSSGTVSKLLRDEWFRGMKRWTTSRYTVNQRLNITPLQSADSWIVDRVQFAFAKFAEVYDGEWETWMDCWESYLKQMQDVQFISSYMGGTDYNVRGYPRRFETRHHAVAYEQSIYNGSREEYERDVVGKLGTIRQFLGEDFPDDRVCCLFPFCTPAYWDHGWKLHPDYPQPRIGISVCRDRCSYECDAKFDPSIEQWDEWREIAMNA